MIETMLEFVQSNILYIGIAVVLYGFANYFYKKRIIETGEKVEAVIVKVKEKRSKNSRYSYPKLKLINEYNEEHEFYCYSARVTGWDKYHVGGTVTVTKYNSLFRGVRYLANVNMMWKSLSISGIGLMFMLFHFLDLS